MRSAAFHVVANQNMRTGRRHLPSTADAFLRRLAGRAGPPFPSSAAGAASESFASVAHIASGHSTMNASSCSCRFHSIQRADVPVPRVRDPKVPAKRGPTWSPDGSHHPGSICLNCHPASRGATAATRSNLAFPASAPPGSFPPFRFLATVLSGPRHRLFRRDNPACGAQ
jgi:hypothetical protein